MSLTNKPEYKFAKPHKYPWAYDAWLFQQKVHWLPEEVPLYDDVKDWHNNLTEAERNLVTQIFRFFTQSDVEVCGAYHLYRDVFFPVEIQMMFSAFENMETIHVAAYSHLLDTIGMPETEYQAFLKYKEMKDKCDYFKNFTVENKHEIAKTIACFAAFTEGLQLFASFAILLNFPRFNKLKGMGQIVTWSVRDESLHVEAMVTLFHAFIDENPEIWTEKLKQEIVEICTTVVEHEDAFIDLAFEMGPVHGTNADDIKQYIRYIADRRMLMLKMEPIYGVTKMPIPWLNEILNSVEHANFFETRATEYSKASVTGDWDDAFS